MHTYTPGIGIVSLGWMGTVHARAHRQVAERFPELGIRPRLVAVAEVSAERRAYATEVLGFARAYADYADLLADPEVDLVSICAPNALHTPVALAAARAGMPFWIEKPAGRSLSETRLVAEAAAASGIETAVGFNYRHVPALVRLRELVAGGELGRITNVRGRFFADYSADPRGVRSWRFVREQAGSGVLGDLMGHLVDLVTHVVAPITSVSARTRTMHTERPLPVGDGPVSHFAAADADPGEAPAALAPVENEDYAAVLAELDGGPLAVLEASRISVGTRASYTFEVHGTEGSAAWDFERLNELHIARSDAADQGFTRVMAGPGFGDFARFQPGAGTSMGFDDLKVIEAAGFLAACRDAASRDTSVRDTGRRDAGDRDQSFPDANHRDPDRLGAPGPDAPGPDTPGPDAPGAEVADDADPHGVRVPASAHARIEDAVRANAVLAAAERAAENGTWEEVEA